MGEGIEAPELPEALQGTELLTVALIAIASLTTGWCAFQSALWGGRQTFAILEANAANVQATEANLHASQLALLDVAMFMQWLDARQRGDLAIAGFYEGQFRHEFAPAFRAWREQAETDPSRAPSTPFAVHGYTSAERARGTELAAESRTATAHAAQYNRTSDEYALMTVLLAAVSVMAGLAEKLRQRRARNALFVVAIALLALSILRIAFLPITWVG